jgi:integrase/recombinase XerC
MRVSQAVAAFAVHLQANGKSPRTIDGYRRDLALLISFTDDAGVESLTPDLLARFVVSDPVRLSRDGRLKAVLTVNHLKAALKSFGRWLAATSVLPNDPARTIEIRRAERRSPNSLTEAERKKLLREVAARKGSAAARDRVMLDLFLGTGVRLAELVNLDIGDVDLDGKRITIRAKGGRSETRFLNSKLRVTLRKYLRRRADMPSHSAALFLSNRNRRISTRQVQTRFNQWLAWAGIEREGLTVHSLRHTFGTRLYRKTHDLVLVGKAMGHRSVEATRVYVHEDVEALEEALETL